MTAARHAVRVAPYESAAKETWDAFVRTAKNGNFLFLRDYMDYHRDRFVDRSLMFYRDDRLVGCLPANRVGAVLYSHQGLTFGGLIVDRKLRLADMLEMFSTLRTYMNAHGLRELIYRAIPHPYHSIPAGEDIFALCQSSARVVDAKPTCVMRVGRPAPITADRKRDFAGNRLSGVRVAREFDFARFMELCAQNLQARHQAVPVHSSAEMAHLAHRFPDHIQLYIARRGSTLLAGAVIYRNAVCCRGQYSATTSEGRQSAARTAIHEHILTEVLEAGTWYDAGHAIEPATGILNQGLMYFKESLGGRTIAQLTFSMAVD